jgi:predicted ATPase
MGAAQLRAVRHFKLRSMAAYRKEDLEFVPSLQLFAQARAQSPTTVLAGGNNTGKSLTLRWLKATLGRSAYFVGTNRFYHVYHFSTGLREPNELDQFESNFQSQFRDERYNFEQNVFDLSRIIIGLNDKRRDELFKLCGELIENQFSLKKVEQDNDLSPRYIDMDGQNLSVGSTGARLLMTILGLCMDDRFSSMLIDEPELGLSPKVQEALSTFLHDQEQRKKYFPHLERVYLATHSHLFLCRTDITSNYIVAKQERRITLTRVQEIGEFHRLQFNLLGNAFESMFFPSAIVVVEGKTDHAYLDRAVQLRLRGRRVTVIPGAGDVKKKVYGLREAFGDLEKNPFRARLFVVLDKTHQPGLEAELVKLGVLAPNIVVWPKNGIEYYYPTEILMHIFACSASDVAGLIISGDVVTLNGISKTKNDLATEVLRQMDASIKLPQELETRLLKPLENAIE